MTCDDVRDQAAAFVLGALAPAEERAVREHLATCPEAHEEFAELGGVVPALATTVEPVEPPPALRERIMAAAAADQRERRVDAGSGIAVPDRAVADRGDADRAHADVAPPAVVSFRAAGARSRASRYGWALGIAAALVIAALGAWNVRLQGQLSEAQAYQGRVEDVLAIARQPGAVMAVLTSGTAGAQDGLVAIGRDGRAAMVVKGLAAASGNEVYEVWFIVGTNDPLPVGALSQEGGLAYMTGTPGPLPAGAIVALTREPGPNPKAPSSAPLVKGVVGPSS
jgi:anti-sigma factor RsiW